MKIVYGLNGVETPLLNEAIPTYLRRIWLDMDRSGVAEIRLALMMDMTRPDMFPVTRLSF